MFEEIDKNTLYIKNIKFFYCVLVKANFYKTI